MYIHQVLLNFKHYKIKTLPASGADPGGGGGEALEAEAPPSYLGFT